MADLSLGVDHFSNDDNDGQENAMQILKSLYQKEERERQQRQQNKHKTKVKVGCIVDVFSSSKNEWIEGTVLQIKGDTMCVLYDNYKKKKWLHKRSSNVRGLNKASPSGINSVGAISPVQSSSPPAAFSTPVIIEEPHTAFSYGQCSPSSVPSVSVSAQSKRHRWSSSSTESACAFTSITYDVIFESKTLGIAFSSDKLGMNCVIDQCLDDFALKSVQRGSTVCAVNGKDVTGLPYTTIVDIIHENATIPPIILSLMKPIIDESKEDQFILDEIEAMAMDNLGLKNSVDIRYLIESEGLLKENVLFSERIKKINRKGKKQERVLIITEKAIYYLKPKKLSKSQRRISISDIGMITLSSLSPEFAVHVPFQYDAHFISIHKDQIADLLRMLYLKETKTNLIVMHSERKHLKDIILTKKLAKFENRTSKITINKSIITLKDLFQDMDD